MDPRASIVDSGAILRRQQKMRVHLTNFTSSSCNWTMPFIFEFGFERSMP
jgi:hypothetical protein